MDYVEQEFLKRREKVLNREKPVNIKAVNNKRSLDYDSYSHKIKKNKVNNNYYYYNSGQEYNSDCVTTSSKNDDDNDNADYDVASRNYSFKYI